MTFLDPDATTLEDFIIWRKIMRKIPNGSAIECTRTYNMKWSSNIGAQPEKRNHTIVAVRLIDFPFHVNHKHGCHQTQVVGFQIETLSIYLCLNRQRRRTS